MFLTLLQYYQTLWYFIVQGNSLSSCPHFPSDRHARMYVYSLVVAFKIWDKPHYRNKTFQDDLIKNLRNVAIPGTGIPLSLFCIHRYLALFFLLVLLPLFSFVSALLAFFQSQSFSDTFYSQLVLPKDWFSLWQLNCRLCSYHAFLTKSSSYDLENKWEFLKLGSCLTPPTAVTPWIKDLPAIVVKDKNEEGGMGVFIYKNAAMDGNWIIQEKLENADFIAEMLPFPAPLSTFRVITSSTAWMDGDQASQTKSVKALSCVFRAGLRNAKTDHESILFDVDLSSGTIGKGTSNAHWYELGVVGLWRWFDISSFFSKHDVIKHFQSNVEIAGQKLKPSFVKEMKQAVLDAHFRMMPDVPMVGWDVAVTNKGVNLLEANLSCNFFRGTFDRNEYFDMVDRFFIEFERKYK